MEEILQAIVELILQFLFEALADFLWRHLTEPTRITIKAFLLIVSAALLGWISTLLAPAPFLRWNTLSILYLAVAPVLIALGMAWIGRYLVRREKRRSSLERFGYAWLFAFAFALTRYLLTK